MDLPDTYFSKNKSLLCFVYVRKLMKMYCFGVMQI